jgi:hypothetical protein
MFQYAPELFIYTDADTIHAPSGEGPYIAIQEAAPFLDPSADDARAEIIPAALKLSVLVRTFSRDVEAAAVALQSAKRFLPNALEFVVVVPEPDLAQAREALPDFAVVKGEPILMPDQSMQQKYTKLMGDTVRVCV